MRTLRMLTLAALALAGSVHAQSNLTIYGFVDMGVTNANKGTSINDGIGPAGVWAVKQGHASWIGFRGTEDLGGGLYSRFDIQHRFSPDTGTLTTPTSFWAGRSIVALGSKQYGEVFMGRNYSPTFYVQVQGDPSGNNYASQLCCTYSYAGFNSSAAQDSGALRKSNMVAYKTPDFGGVTAEASVALGEGAGRKKSLGANIQYSKGPVYLGAAYEGVDSDNRLYMMTASYDFGVVKPSISYANARGGNQAGAAAPDYRGNDLMLGASVPMGSGRLFFGGARLNQENGAPEVTSTKVMGGYEYFLSKRTLLYTSVGSAKTDGHDRSTAFDFGITHSF